MEPDHTRILIVPDCHADPDEAEYARFRWLGLQIKHLRPMHIVFLGDLGDFHSVSHYESAAGKEGKRLHADFDACVEALEYVREYAEDAWTDAEKFFCVGNHELRVARYLEEHPVMLEGDPVEYTLKKMGITPEEFTIAGFMDPLDVKGVLFAHSLPRFQSGKPIGGKTAAQTLLAEYHRSCVVGHSHLLQFATDTVFGRGRIFGLSAGCLLDSIPRYVKAKPKWWSGISYLDWRGDVDEWAVCFQPYKRLS